MSYCNHRHDGLDCSACFMANWTEKENRMSIRRMMLPVLGLVLVAVAAVLLTAPRANAEPSKTPVAAVLYEHRTVTVHRPCSTVVKQQASPAGWDHWRTTSKKVRWHQCR